jgi:hypothetical protein
MTVRHRMLVGSLVTVVTVGGACRDHSLEAAYRQLYVSKYAIEFPASEEELQRCRRDKIQPCLSLVERAREGKNSLLAMGPARALDLTLGTIVSTCPSQRQEREEVCLGAIIALYFFREPDQDERIRHSLLKADRKVLEKVFSRSLFAWYGNRPQPQLWVQALKDLPRDVFPGNGKDVVMQAFAALDGQVAGGVTLLR